MYSSRSPKAILNVHSVNAASVVATAQSAASVGHAVNVAAKILRPLLLHRQKAVKYAAHWTTF